MTDVYRLHHLTLSAPGEALFAALATAIPGLSRHRARQAVMAGLVSIDGLPVLEAKHPIPEAGVRVDVDLRHGVAAPLRARLHDQAAPSERPFSILYRDTSLLIIDKAAGILSAPTHRPGAAVERGHIPELLRRYARKQGEEMRFIGVVHRLDKETSGCLCFAMSREAQRLLAIQFASHAAVRTYRCLVSRTPAAAQGTISGLMTWGRDGRRTILLGRTPPPPAADADSAEHDDEDAGEEAGRRAGPRQAITHYRVLRRFRHAGVDHGAELQVTLETGRTHQIRVSLSAIGCPVMGERIYHPPVQARRSAAPRPVPARGRGAGRDAPAAPVAVAVPPPKAPRLMLHAEELSLDHPLTGERLTVRAPIPPLFDRFAAGLPSR